MSSQHKLTHAINSGNNSETEKQLSQEELLLLARLEEQNRQVHVYVYVYVVKLYCYYH